MSKQLFIYEKAVPVSNKNHSKSSVEPVKDFSFIQNLGFIPLTLIEFHEVSKEYPIVFSIGKNGMVFPVALTGVSKFKNLFVGEGGSIESNYIPVFVRQYPFVFAETEQETKFSLYVDEAYAGLNTAGSGMPLFDGEGQPSEYLNKKVKFLKEVQIQFAKTKVFCEQLKEHKLLKPISITFKLGGDKNAQEPQQYLIVDRSKLKELDDEILGQLVRNDTLELLYLHHFSIKNMDSLVEIYKEKNS